MPQRHSLSLRYDDGQLSVLDQRLLPQEERWHLCATPGDLIGHIHSLAVRGAPLIGLAACFMLAQEARRGESAANLLHTLAALRASRPTAVNLMNYLARMEALIRDGADAAAIEALAIAIFDDDQQLCDRMAEHGLPLIQAGSKILTHCNTGSLATAGRGTAIGVITAAHEAAIPISVWVGETRPLLQGGRLTAWEMGKAGISHQLLCDSAAASLMQAGEVDIVLVGADRIAANGDTANKVGTYSLALAAHHHRIPFWIVAPQTTVDMNCPKGGAIPIEQRPASEVRGVSTAAGSLTWSPESAPVYNPAFDVTPAELITGWVFDCGRFTDFASYRAFVGNP